MKGDIFSLPLVAPSQQTAAGGSRLDSFQSSPSAAAHKGPSMLPSATYTDAQQGRKQVVLTAHQSHATGEHQQVLHHAVLGLLFCTLAKGMATTGHTKLVTLGITLCNTVCTILCSFHLLG